MLKIHSPDLESLSLGGLWSQTPRRIDIRPLTTGQWNKLTSLKLGDTLISNPTDHYPCHFVDFLSRHPALKVLHIEGRRRHFPGRFILEQPSFLPNLEEFSGDLCPLMDLAMENKAHMRKLLLPRAPHTYHNKVGLCAALSGFSNVTSFAVIIDASQPDWAGQHNHVGMLGDILSNFRALEHLEVNCVTDPRYTIRFVSFPPPNPSI
jgi:hypothetical protein